MTCLVVKKAPHAQDTLTSVPEHPVEVPAQPKLLLKMPDQPQQALSASRK